MYVPMQIHLHSLIKHELKGHDQHDGSLYKLVLDRKSTFTLNASFISFLEIP